MRHHPTVDLTNVRVRESGATAERSGALVSLRVPGVSGETLLTIDQALALSAEMIAAANAVTRSCGGAS